MLSSHFLNRCPANLKEKNLFRTTTDSPNTMQESVNINPNQSLGHVSVCVLPRLHCHLLVRGLRLQQTSRRQSISAWLNLLASRTPTLGVDDCNLVAVSIPPAIPDATAGADRGIDRPSTPDPKYAQGHHILSSMDKRKGADFFPCRLRHQGERAEVRCGMEKGSLATAPNLF